MGWGRGELPYKKFSGTCRTFNLYLLGVLLLKGRLGCSTLKGLQQELLCYLLGC